MSVDYFLKIDGIEGESQDSKHKNEIELAQFCWDEHQSGTFAQGTGAGAGKVRMNDFAFEMRTNKSSPKLFLACATGQHIKDAVVTCRKAGGGQQDYYIITMSDVLVASYETGSASESVGNGEGRDGQGYDEGVPRDRIKINFAKIEVEYRAQKEDGSLDNPIKAGYDLKSNKTV